MSDNVQGCGSFGSSWIWIIVIIVLFFCLCGGGYDYGCKR